MRHRLDGSLVVCSDRDEAKLTKLVFRFLELEDRKQTDQVGNSGTNRQISTPLDEGMNVTYKIPKLKMP